LSQPYVLSGNEIRKVILKFSVLVIMLSHVDGSRSSRNLLTSVQQHLKERKRKCLCFEETVNTCFGSLHVFRNRELRHEARLQATTTQWA
jgi:hypothetical protein